MSEGCDVCIGSSDGESCEFFSESEPVARKQKQCSECDGVIAPAGDTELSQAFSAKPTGSSGHFMLHPASFAARSKKHSRIFVRGR